MERVPEPESPSLLSSRAMRNAALVGCAYMLIMAVNAVIQPVASHPANIALFPPDLFPWIPVKLVLVLNLVFYGWLFWFLIALIRASQCVEERVLIAAFATSWGFGLVTHLSSRTATAIAQYGEVGVWAIASAAVGRLVVRHRHDPDVEEVAQPAGKRGLFTTAALFVGETLTATAGTMLVVAFALRLLYPIALVVLPAIAKDSPTALNFLPFFPIQIAVGFALGFLTALQFKSRTGMFVWIVPLVVTLVYICTFEPESVFQNRWIAVLSRLFGTSCRPPHCYDQAIVVAPLYSAVAFSIGAWMRMRRAPIHSDLLADHLDSSNGQLKDP